MTVEISTQIAATLVRDAAAWPDREVCGLLFGDRDRIAEARPCRNVAADPARAFEIDPVPLIAAHRAMRGGGPKLIGHYHSHPSGDPVPSRVDAAAAGDPGALWLLIAGTRIRAWRAVEGGAHLGAFDPVTLLIRPACAHPAASPEEPQREDQGTR